MGPEDHHEEPAEQDGYEKWLSERETEKLAKIIKPEPVRISESDMRGVFGHRCDQKDCPVCNDASNR
jgi:hypothetical protein